MDYLGFLMPFGKNHLFQLILMYSPKIIFLFY